MFLRKILSGKKQDPHCSVVVVAGGSGERMGRDKLFMDLKGMPVLAYSLKVFQASERVDEIIVVTREDKIAEASEICHRYNFTKVSKVVKGGASRTESALAGVSELGPKCELVAVHDGARPFVTERMVTDAVDCAQQYMAAVPVIPCTDTVRIVDDAGVITQETDRSHAVAVQTPQVFHADILKGALSYAVSHGLSLTDDSSAVAMMGVRVHTVTGDPENIKLTVPDDLIKAGAILESRGVL